MTPQETLAALKDANITLWYEQKDGRDLWTSGPVSDDIAAAIRANKAVLILLLTTTSDTLDVVYHRVARGSDILCAMEGRGDAVSERYGSVLGAWLRMLAQYEDMERDAA